MSTILRSLFKAVDDRIIKNRLIELNFIYSKCSKLSEKQNSSLRIELFDAFDLNKKYSAKVIPNKELVGGFIFGKKIENVEVTYLKVKDNVKSINIQNVRKFFSVSSSAHVKKDGQSISVL